MTSGAILSIGAFAAGVLSASSPCVLPVIPGYLATLSVRTHADDEHQRRSVTGAVGFVAGFSVVFTLLGATASALGNALYQHLNVLLPLAGALLILLGLNTFGFVPLRLLNRERRPIAVQSVGIGPRRSVLLGMVFAVGWTPCIGPILATVLTTAATRSSLPEGMGLLMLYSLGLGLPFVGFAAWFDRSVSVRHWLSRNSRRVQRLGATAMVVIGVGYIAGFWSTIFVGAQRWLAKSGWPPL